MSNLNAELQIHSQSCGHNLWPDVDVIFHDPHIAVVSTGSVIVLRCRLVIRCWAVCQAKATCSSTVVHSAVFP